MKIEYVVLAVLAALVLGASGGMWYEKSMAAKTMGGGRNFAQGGRNGGDQGGQRGMGANGGMRRGGNFVMGEVLAKDDKSLTVKTPDGGSTIVYFSDTVAVRKAETGSLRDLSVGEQVVVNGKTSGDGSVSAESIQIAPQPAE